MFKQLVFVRWPFKAKGLTGGTFNWAIPWFKSLNIEVAKVILEQFVRCPSPAMLERV